MQEGNTKHKEWPIGRWNIERHKGNAAAPTVLIDIVFGLQIQDVTFDCESKLWKTVVVLAILVHLKLFDELVNDVGWACKLGGACVHSNVAIDAEFLFLIVKRDVFHLDLP